MKAKGDIKEKFWNSKDICKISIPYLKWLLLSWEWRLTEDGEFRLNFLVLSVIGSQGDLGNTIPLGDSSRKNLELPVV